MGMNIPCISDGGKIAFGDPSVPMVLEDVLGRVVVLVLTERPFVDDGIVTCIVKKAGGNPRLRQDGSEAETIGGSRKPTSRTSQPPRLTPRTFCEP